MRPKIVFFGTSLFGQIVLQKLLDKDFEVVAGVTQPDRPAGREGQLVPSPVKTLAKEYKIKIFTPENKLELFAISPKLLAKKAALFVVASYGLIIPAETLAIPARGALNVHPSLLPKYRGASPIQAAILAGDLETGVTIMLMDEQMDHGPILAQERIALAPAETTPSATVKLANLGAELLIRTIPPYLFGKITPLPQDHSQATYTKLITKEDGHINWEQNNAQIERMLRAYHPWPGVWTTVGEMAIQLDRELRDPRKQNLRLKILQAHLENDTLSLDSIQVEGKSPIKFADFSKGYLS
uniref:Methionyl-tRNA formyltransferase n=1 Tax=candidate division WWE3 bacterium TaxID=2053526 RepID=A0A831Z004_UNCKA